MRRRFREILNEPDFQRMVGLQTRTYGPGDVIVEEGAMGTEVYLILHGRVEVFAAVDHLGTPGRTMGIAKLAENDIIGELCLFDIEPRVASVVATRDCEMVVMDAISLGAFMDAHPAMGYWILKDIFSQVVQRMRQTTLRSNAITALYLNDCAE